MICLGPCARAGEPTLCSPPCALPSRCHLCCRTSSLQSASLCRLPPQEHSWLSPEPSGPGPYENPQVSPPAPSAPDSLEERHPRRHPLMHYPLLHRCLCHNQTGTESPMVLSVPCSPQLCRSRGHVEENDLRTPVWFVIVGRRAFFIAFPSSVC